MRFIAVVVLAFFYPSIVFAKCDKAFVHGLDDKNFVFFAKANGDPISEVKLSPRPAHVHHVRFDALDLALAIDQSDANDIKLNIHHGHQTHSMAIPRAPLEAELQNSGLPDMMRRRREDAFSRLQREGFGGATRPGITLIELLVSMAIVALLLALLAPAIVQVRSSARAIQCQSNLKQFGIALNNAISSNGPFPAARTQEAGKDRWWFGETTPGSKIVDTARGHLMPYLENNKEVATCPDLTEKVKPTYSGKTGGYGYNYRRLAKIEFKFDSSDNSYKAEWIPVRPDASMSMSTTIAFTDSAGTWIDPWPSGPAGLVEAPLIEPPSGEYPSVHFRHKGGVVANLLFLDGHVEGRTEGTRNAPPTWEPQQADDLRDAENIYDIGRDDKEW